MLTYDELVAEVYATLSRWPRDSSDRHVAEDVARQVQKAEALKRQELG
jgi:hypothetical protein